MAAERRDEDTRELRLEGLGLIVTGGVIVALLAGSFYLGRWVERQAAPAGAGPAASAADGPLAGLDRGGEPPTTVDVDGGSDIFDSSAGGAVEPGRETAAAAAPVESAPQPTAPAAKPPATSTGSAAQDGGFWVQVFAGRDRASAETLVTELRNKGYGVAVVSDRDGGGTVFKVRVGGYTTRDAAVDAAQTLKKAGYSTWVTSAG